MTTKETTPVEMTALQDEIRQLREQLTASDKARTDAEEMALAMAQASPFAGNGADEQPTGRTVAMQICLNPTERDVKKQKFKTVDMPTYYYTIQIPVGAGADLATNGVAYYHGQTYEFNQQELADMKSRVARCWDHERAIHSENENAYRKPLNTHLMGTGVN